MAEGSVTPSSLEKTPQLDYWGGFLGAMLPFVVFLIGVAWLGLSGAPDERGFWPILLFSLGVGLFVAKDGTAYAEAIVSGMSRPIVVLMIMAWLLAGVLGSLVAATGMVDVLARGAEWAGLRGGGFAAASFLIAAAVSTSTGTSLGTLLVCAPLLYPAGGALGTDPVILIGAILGGATFGDNISPVSDTTIASSMTQGADMGGVVRSRLRYALPAAALALGVAFLMGGSAVGNTTEGLMGPRPSMDLLGLVGALGPAIAVVLLLRKRHLIEALMVGVGVTALAGLLFHRFSFHDLLHVDTEAFIARGLLLGGMERAVGISVFTILLMGLVAGVEASGIVDRTTRWVSAQAKSPRSTEWSIFGAVSAAVLLTTHSVVAILTVGQFAKETGEKAGIDAYRRANLLDVTVCTYPFLLPFFIPTILAASQTAAGEAFGMPRVSPLEAGFANAHSWGLLVIIVASMMIPKDGTSGHRPPEKA